MQRTIAMGSHHQQQQQLALVQLAQNELIARLYTANTSLTAQLQALVARMHKAQAQLDAANAEASQRTVTIETLRRRICELENDLASRCRQTGQNAVPRPGPNHHQGLHAGIATAGKQTPTLTQSWATLLQRTQQEPISSKSSSHSTASERSSIQSGKVVAASDSSVSSLGAPGPTLTDEGAEALRAGHGSVNGTDGCLDVTGLVSRGETQRRPGELHDDYLTMPAQPSQQPQRINARLTFRERLASLLDTTASFAQRYTNQPDAAADARMPVGDLLKMGICADRDTLAAFLSSSDTRCGLVNRVINQFLAQYVLSFEVIKGFNAAADAEIRASLQLLYSNRPGLVRSLVHTHLANQVLMVRGQPCFLPQFQARQSVNANTLLAVILPFLADTSPSTATASPHVAGPHAGAGAGAGAGTSSMRSELLDIMQQAHMLGLDMISGAYATMLFWPRVGDAFDPVWMSDGDAGVIGHKVKEKKAGAVRVAMSPAVWFADYTQATVAEQQAKMVMPAQVLLRPTQVLRYGTTGGLVGLGAGLGGLLLAQRRVATIRNLTLPMKSFLVTSSGTIGGILAADRGSRRFEFDTNAKKREYFAREEQLREAHRARLSAADRVLEWCRRERYSIVGATWLASLRAKVRL
ncbi:hypothetical protein KEM52_004970 [Ascosphaera acerosa]|nr:hypothetical protein KEM52_004970 [Ascosphaera acerosa]